MPNGKGLALRVAEEEDVRKKKLGIPYSYQFDLALLANGTDTDTETLPGDTDFVLTHITAVATSMAFTLQITDDRLSWDLFKQAINAQLLFGPIGALFDRPFYVAAPYRFKASSSIVVDGVDASGVANAVMIGLHGFYILQKAK